MYHAILLLVIGFALSFTTSIELCAAIWYYSGSEPVFVQCLFPAFLGLLERKFEDLETRYNTCVGLFMIVVWLLFAYFFVSKYII